MHEEACVTAPEADRNSPQGARNMGKNDLWIAATDLHCGLVLLSTDKDIVFLNDNPIQVLRIDPKQGPILVQ